MQVIDATWPKDERTVCFTSTRLAKHSSKGHSEGAFRSFNTGLHVGDNASSVALNRAEILAHCQLDDAQWLEQIHAIECVKAQRENTVLTADACWSNEANLACIVMTADCLPVAFRDGENIAVAHAGWRGLLNGVLENTLLNFDTSSTDVWLGPAIGPAAFEVGSEVRDMFMAQQDTSESCFVASHHQGKWLADIYQLARLRLQAIGIDLTRIYGGEHCTFTDEERFYSYRRESITGRMATVIYRKD